MGLFIKLLNFFSKACIHSESLSLMHQTSGKDLSTPNQAWAMPCLSSALRHAFLTGGRTRDANRAACTTGLTSGYVVRSGNTCQAFFSVMKALGDITRRISSDAFHPRSSSMNISQ